MLIDRKNTSWVTFSALAAVAACIGYGLDSSHRAEGMGRYGSSPLGLSLGVLGLLIMLFLVGLAVKRKAPSVALGRAQTWLRGHIWLGLLLVPLVALHAAFKTGGGLTSTLWVLLGLVTASGIFGVILQQTVPRLLLYSVPGETVAQQLDRELASLLPLAESVVAGMAAVKERPVAVPVAAVVASSAAGGGSGGAVAGVSGNASGGASGGASGNAFGGPGGAGDSGRASALLAVRQFYDLRVKAYLAGQNEAAFAGHAELDALFESLLVQTAPELHPALASLESLCRRRQQLLRQRLLMRVLLGWLVVHVPLSWMLLALTVVHAVVSLRYR